jgi:hypothetical protein
MGIQDSFSLALLTNTDQLPTFLQGKIDYVREVVEPLFKPGSQTGE